MRKISILLLGACFLTATSIYAQKVKPATKPNETKVVVATKISGTTPSLYAEMATAALVNNEADKKPTEATKVAPAKTKKTYSQNKKTTNKSTNK